MPDPPLTSDPADEIGDGSALRDHWIVLLGLRASGKTTIGRGLSRRLGCRAVDLDDLVRRRFGDRSVHDIWASDGEAAWRDAEVAALVTCLTEPPGVLALGGGTAAIPAAAETLRTAQSRGRVRLVYLRASVARLAGRLRRRRGDRPGLGPAAGAGEEEGIEAEVRWAHEQRDSGYRSLADVVIELDDLHGDGERHPRVVVDAVLDGLSRVGP